MGRYRTAGSLQITAPPFDPRCMMNTPEPQEVLESNDEEIRRLLEQAKVKIEDYFPLTSITKLDLSNCNLSTLPTGFSEALPNLSILFASKNRFGEMPAEIGRCQKLQMVAFKENGMETIHPDALQPQLRWLILTDNKLQKLPEEIGRCTLLQKFMLSGNLLVELPESIVNCKNLELIRLASNNLKEPPTTLLQLPKLSWVALSDNPFLQNAASSSHGSSSNSNTDSISTAVMEPLPILEGIDDLPGEELGRGAGGVTRRVQWGGRPVAVKTYNGVITSDGLPEQERILSCAASALQSDCLIKVIGESAAGSLVMEYLDNYRALADPPNFDTCSRDVYPDKGSPRFIWEHAELLVTGLLEALHKLHATGICHGDFYGHNILLDRDNYAQVKLSDFGAAFFYDRGAEYGKQLERCELRAFACLVEEVDGLLLDEDSTGLLKEMAAACRLDASTFDTVHIWWKQKQLQGLAKAFGADAF